MEILVAIFIFFTGFGLAFLWNALVVWLLCWGLHALGIFTIGAFAVQFSWPLVLVFTLISGLINSSFKISFGERD